MISGSEAILSDAILEILKIGGGQAVTGVWAGDNEDCIRILEPASKKKSSF